jgi:hypothetical protein
MKRSRIKETINLAGSVASITGVSLLWLQSIWSSTNILLAVRYLPARHCPSLAFPHSPGLSSRLATLLLENSRLVQQLK